MTRHTTAVTIAVAVVAPLACGLAVLGGIGSFTTIRHLAVPWFGPSAWIVPVGIDMGILALLAWDLLAEYLAIPWPVLRWIAWGFIAATVYLNVAAAHGNLTAAIMHAAMPALFITVIEGIRHLTRQSTGLANGTRIEHIPFIRWVLAPRSSSLLFRHMALWHVTSYQQGLTLEHQRLQAIARLQQAHGHYLWRCRAPLSERLALRLGPSQNVAGAPLGVAQSPTEAVRGLLPRHCLIALPGPSVSVLNDRDKRLVTEATAIVQHANNQGVSLSQAELARRLRARGHQVANDRLRWLMMMADKNPHAGVAAEPHAGQS